MEKSKKKGSIRGRVKKRISKIQYQKAIKNESYYANLSALFLCVSIALGLGGVVAGSVLTVVYQPILNETLSIVFILISTLLLLTPCSPLPRCCSCYTQRYSCLLSELRPMIHCPG